MNICQQIKQAAKLLIDSENPKHEAQLLLGYVLNKDRSYLIAYPEQVLSDKQVEVFSRLIQRRLQGEPIAYILGEKEFWSLTLKVTPDTLIPRPETELLVEQVLAKLPQDKLQRVADLGTGTGAIALAIATERLNWELTATDCSKKALLVAKQNAAHHHIKNVMFAQGTWCDALPNGNYHVIVSNPPYIGPDDPHLKQGDVRFEPSSALVSNEAGLKDLKTIIYQALDYLVIGGWLMLEHGYDQGEALRQIMLEAGYQDVETHLDLAGCERVTVGRIRL
jgi:release factor glutamine methyltransferase